uniref:BCNT-C domain-containing protein n=1 Tax=Grammatophora oceanica TaxID=210454 RepID=A0A7S1VGP4_9STRA
MEEDEQDVLPGSDNAASTIILSLSKQKAVDEAFERLFGYKFGTRFMAKRRTVKHQQELSKQEELLTDIFGPTIATKLLATSKSVRKPIKRLPLPKDIHETITEVKKYAGKSITIQRRVAIQQNAQQTTKSASSTTANPNSRSASAAKPAGLDHLLNQISGPSKLTTVAKTSSDWDSFKTKSGMEEQLEKKAQGKDAFLVKKDFLNRVDERRFEHEKSKREQERSARAASGKK